MKYISISIYLSIYIYIYIYNKLYEPYSAVDGIKLANDKSII